MQVPLTPIPANGVGAQGHARQWRASRALSPQRERGWKTQFGVIELRNALSAVWRSSASSTRRVISEV